MMAEEMSSWDRRCQMEKQETLIEGARYQRYRGIKMAGFPEYLRRKGKRNSQQKSRRGVQNCIG